ALRKYVTIMLQPDRRISFSFGRKRGSRIVQIDSAAVIDSECVRLLAPAGDPRRAATEPDAPIVTCRKAAVPDVERRAFTFSESDGAMIGGDNSRKAFVRRMIVQVLIDSDRAAQQGEPAALGIDGRVGLAARAECHVFERNLRRSGDHHPATLPRGTSA